MLTNDKTFLRPVGWIGVPGSGKALEMRLKQKGRAVDVVYLDFSKAFDTPITFS